ncbi:MAG: COX15/CtaA family protein [Deltaproteobacteria bacterium]|nr:COX15/CtaA family protein [Deltaproteobacteria bacterium]
MTPIRYQRLTTFVILANLAVIVWGAFVRASGSGAGCGNHWPMCNGQVLPAMGSTKTMIEFTHRVTSGLALIGVVLQYVFARRLFAKGTAARRAAGFALLFIVTEALVGAGLVLFEMVAHNKSVARAWWMTAHLLNTFALVAALTLAWWHARPRKPLVLPTHRYVALSNLCLAGVTIVALSGAIAALGDTLFPASSLAAGFAHDFIATAHLFVRLRIWHPFLAVSVGALLLAVSGRLLLAEGFEGVRNTATAIAALVVLQLSLGIVNLLLLAPVPLQLIHLLVADLLWMTLVVLRAQMGAAAKLPQVAGVHVPAPRLHTS